MNKLVNEELQAMKYLLGYQRGKVISEQAAAQTTTTPAAAQTPQTVEDVVKQIQTILKTKYGANLGTTGPNKDGVDGKWGTNTQTAFEAALKSKGGQSTPAATTTTPAAAPAATTPAATTTTPAAAPTTTTPAATTTTPAAENPADITGVETAQPTRRQIRRQIQDINTTAKRQKQDLRAQPRA